MLERILYGSSIALIFVTLGFAAPSAVGVSKSSPEKVQKTSGTVRSSGSSRTRGPRYVYVGGYTRGK